MDGMKFRFRLTTKKSDLSMIDRSLTAQMVRGGGIEPPWIAPQDP